MTEIKRGDNVIESVIINCLIVVCIVIYITEMLTANKILRIVKEFRKTVLRVRLMKG